MIKNVSDQFGTVKIGTVEGTVQNNVVNFFVPFSNVENLPEYVDSLKILVCVSKTFHKGLVISQDGDLEIYVDPIPLSKVLRLASKEELTFLLVCENSRLRKNAKKALEKGPLALLEPIFFPSHFNRIRFEGIDSIFELISLKAKCDKFGGRLRMHEGFDPWFLEFERVV